MADTERHASLLERIPEEPSEVFPYSSPTKRYEIALFHTECEREEQVLLTEEGKREMHTAEWRLASEFLGNLRGDSEAGLSAQAYAAAVERACCAGRCGWASFASWMMGRAGESGGWNVLEVSELRAVWARPTQTVRATQERARGTTHHGANLRVRRTSQLVGYDHLRLLRLI